MANKRHKAASVKRDSGAFVIIPMAVLKSQAYLDAGPYARMLLFDLTIQYRGNNNGDLCAAWKLMKPRGWRSEATLYKAKCELLELGLVVETRKGARPNKASLYALTWHALDDCNGKLDMTPKAFPRSAYLRRNMPPPIKPRNKSLTTPPVVEAA
jgi:hypothetical protein